MQAAGGVCEGRGLAPGTDGSGRARGAERAAHARTSPARLVSPLLGARLPARKASTAAAGGLGAVAVGLAGVGASSQAGPGFFGTFPGKFPERKVLGSGFCLLGFRSRVWASKKKPDSGK